MGVLDRLLGDLTVRGGVFARCAYRGDWQMAVEAHSGQMLFHVIEEGGSEFELLSDEGADNRLRLEAGEIVVLPYGDAHRLWQGEPKRTPPTKLSDSTLLRFANLTNDGAAGEATVFLCGYYQLDPLKAHPLLRQLPRVMVIRAGHDAGQMATIIGVIDREARHVSDGSQTLMNRLTESLLVYQLRAWTQQQHTPAGLLAALADPTVSRALAAMHKNPEKIWTVATLGREARASRAKFAKRFHDLLGCGPIEYLTQLRMSRAAGWLRDTAMPLSEIAERCGYDSAAAFSKAFRKHTGSSPRAFRQRGTNAAND